MERGLGILVGLAGIPFGLQLGQVGLQLRLHGVRPAPGNDQLGAGAQHVSQVAGAGEKQRQRAWTAGQGPGQSSDLGFLDIDLGLGFVDLLREIVDLGLQLIDLGGGGVDLVVQLALFGRVGGDRTGEPPLLVQGVGQVGADPSLQRHQRRVRSRCRRRRGGGRGAARLPHPGGR